MVEQRNIHPVRVQRRIREDGFEILEELDALVPTATPALG
jgi:hypothetical protein